MAERPRCQNRRAEMPANAPQCLCPACLLQRGMESEAVVLHTGEDRASSTTISRSSELPSLKIDPGDHIAMFRTDDCSLTRR
jgi:hypothetical protein